MSNNLGGWAMPQTTFDYIRSILPDGKTILEIGSGLGTEELAKYYKMYSIEANSNWVGKFNSTYIHSPIINYSNDNKAPDVPGSVGWHDVEILKPILPAIKYDLLFIDGPEGRYGRGGFLKNLKLFNVDVPMVFDDINRPNDLIVMKKVAEKLKREYQILDDNVTGVILP